jgi:predicted membrane protein
MALPAGYTETTLAFYMFESLGRIAETLALDETHMTEAVNDVAAACGVTNVADVTDVAKLRSLAKVAALRVAQTTAVNWYDFSADGGDYKRSQVTAQIADMLVAAEAAAMVYSAGYAVQTGTMVFVDDPYAWSDDMEAEGAG